MPAIRWKVVGSKIGMIDIRFRLNLGDRTVEHTQSYGWDGQGTLDAFIEKQVHYTYRWMLQIAAGDTLAQYVGLRGTVETPDLELPAPGTPSP